MPSVRGMPLNLWACSGGSCPYAWAYLNVVVMAVYNDALFWRFTLLTTDTVMCGVARERTDEHFVKRNPKEYEVRWRVGL